MNDTYFAQPQGTYDERRQAYLEFCAAQSPGGPTGFFSQIARLALGLDVQDGPMREAIDYVYTNRDCNDFTLGGLLRMRYLYSEQLGTAWVEEIDKALLWFRYWWDEPPAGDRRCYWTENHQIIFHSDELLAGQLFPDRQFDNDGKPGREHIEHALYYIRRWLDFRIRFGFSEWLSNCYFEEDLLALVNLHDFAEQADVRHQAGRLIDTLMFEMALHTYRGVMGSSHGRTYPRLIKGARTEDATNTAKLMFGMGLYNNPNVLGTVCLATSPYRCPPVIEAIAADLDGPRKFQERHSLNVEDAPFYGISYDSLDDGHLFWSIQDYVHPTIIGLSERLTDTYGIRLHEDYQARYTQLFQWQIDKYGEIVDPNMDCHAMTEVHIQTYRTGNYMLSCAQDYRPGKPGYQQHPWQATLGIDAVVFTNHPGSDDERARPNYWAGNAVLPRAVQHENVLVCLHHIPADDAFPFSHAYFPRAAFDEVVERGNWVFGRKDQGFVAVYTQNAYHWMEDRHDDAHPVIELRVDAPDNVWLVEMGEGDDFAGFVESVASAPVQTDGLSVVYESPSQGRIEFGWDQPLRIERQEIDLHVYPRFDNPYCQAAFGDREYTIQHGGDTYRITFE